MHCKPLASFTGAWTGCGEVAMLQALSKHMCQVLDAQTYLMNKSVCHMSFTDAIVHRTTILEPYIPLYLSPKALPSRNALNFTRTSFMREPCKTLLCERIPGAQTRKRFMLARSASVVVAAKWTGSARSTWPGAAHAICARPQHGLMITVRDSR